MGKKHSWIMRSIAAGLTALSFVCSWSVPSVAAASATKTVTKAAGGLSALAVLAWLANERNAHYYEYATPVGAIERNFTPLGAHDVASMKADAEGMPWKGYEVFYPKDIADGKPVPLVLMANGTGTPVSNYREVLKHLASWGFVVAGNEESDSRSGEGVLATLDYVRSCADDPKSPLYQNVDLQALGVAGHSQGGVGAVHAAMNFSDRAQFRSIFTASMTSPFWGDEGPLGKKWSYDVSSLRTPIFMVAGTGAWDAGKTEDPHATEGQGIAPLWSLRQTYAAIPDTTPKVMARAKGKDHGDMLRAADAYMTAWFAYTLQGNEEAGKAFFGKESELSHNRNYQDVQAKNGTAGHNEEASR